MSTNWKSSPFSGYFPDNCPLNATTWLLVNMSERCKRTVDANSNGGEARVRPKRAKMDMPEAGINSCYTSRDFVERLTSSWRLENWLC